jgi:uncharacterized protein YndB with AHSA1/START domain
MRAFSEETTIAAPAADIFAYVSDMTRHGEWGGHGLQVTKDDDGPVAVGSTYSTVARQFGTQREHSTVTELEPRSVFGWESTGALGTVHHRFSLSARDGSTRVTKSAAFTKESFLAKMTGWKLSKDIPAGLRANLTNIKAHFEGGAALG